MKAETDTWKRLRLLAGRFCFDCGELFPAARSPMDRTGIGVYNRSHVWRCRGCSRAFTRRVRRREPGPGELPF